MGFADPGFDFDRYIAISPSLWWDEGRVLAEVSPFTKKETEVYIALGHEQGLMRDAVLAFVDRFQNASSNRIAFLDLEASESHDSIYLTAFQDAVRTLFLNPMRVHPFQSEFAGLPDHPPPMLSDVATQSLKTPCVSIVAIETSYADIADDPERWNRVCVRAKPGYAPTTE